MPFVKLDCGILRSSIWDLDAETCKVWITLLTMANTSGLVECCSPGVAHEARLPVEKTEACLAILEAPDPRSRTKTDDGRRIERTDEGYLILNYEKYREKDYSNAARQARFKAKKKGKVTEVTALPGEVTALLSASVYASASVLEGKGGVGEGEPLAHEWSPNPDAVEIARQWVAANGKSHRAICSPAKASIAFEGGLNAGIDKHALADAVKKNKGQPPHDIVKAMRPKMDRKNPLKITEEERQARIAAGVAALLADGEKLRRATE